MLTWVQVFQVLGGLGLFLYGMKMMSTGLETVAGDRLQGILQKATSNRFLGVLVGIVATIVINSSTATTIMTVSFVNSGMMNLTQAIGIIMGANVGTTFSAQLIALNINEIAPMFIFIGVVMYVFIKSSRIKNIGFIVLGFGILFFGITTMGAPLRLLAREPAFQEILTTFENPVLALLAGFVFTAIVQSSSASMGILVALHLGDNPIPMSFTTSAFIILGTNIGTSITTVIASIPSNRESKRAALFHIMYDIIGSVVFGTLIIATNYVILSWFTSTWSDPAIRVAMFHTIYNFATMFLLLPFVKYIAMLMKRLIPINEDADEKIFEKKLIYLDSNFNTATMAVYNAHLELCRMGKIANQNFALATSSFFEKNPDKAKKVTANEKIIDFLNHKIAAKLVQINSMSLSPIEANKLGKMFIILSDIERIGDHAVNIATFTTDMKDKTLTFTEDALAELKKLSSLTTKLTTRALNAFEKQDDSRLNKIKSAEKNIDNLAEKYIENHVERLKSETCLPESGVMFTDMVNDLQRSADHAKNIAFSIALEKKWNR
ncbi:MAG: Na/Pi cotransporter family protein [Defluviitaleaceae bacterium]|nr:Na/Pi cotransporter family protein [Defluviitaleaceae bacterium]